MFEEIFIFICGVMLFLYFGIIIYRAISKKTSDNRSTKKDEIEVKSEFFTKEDPEMQKILSAYSYNDFDCFPSVINDCISLDKLEQDFENHIFEIYKERSSYNILKKDHVSHRDIVVKINMFNLHERYKNAKSKKERKYIKEDIKLIQQEIFMYMTSYEQQRYRNFMKDQFKMYDSSFPIIEETKNNVDNNSFEKNSRPRVETIKQKTDSKFYGDICEVINGHSVIYKDDTHTYLVDGKEVPSITTIVGKLSKHFGWDDYGQIDPAILRRAALKGTQLHKEIEDYENNNIFGDSTEFDNYLSLKDKYNFNVQEMEKMVIIEHNREICAAGRLDIIAKMGDYLGIIDIKRTSKLYPKKVQLQLNLYRIGYMQRNPSINIDFLRVIRLRESVKEFPSFEIDESQAKEYLNIYKTITEKEEIIQ